MKRSKLFLGATTAILAIAGVAAAKHYGPVVTRYYITKDGKYCKDQTSTCTNLNGTVSCFYTAIVGPSTTRYALFTKGPVGPKVSTNCITPVLYQTEH